MAAGAVNAAEVYNKDANKLDIYGKVHAQHYFSDDNGSDGDKTYARLGFKGETQINDQLVGFGQWEYEFKGNRTESTGGSNSDKTRLAFAGLKFGDAGSIDYGRNYGAIYDVAAYTDMLVEWGGDGCNYTDNFMTGRTNGVATYRNTDFFGMVDGLNFALQYQGKNNDTTAKKSNGDGFGFSVNYNFDGFGFVGAYSNSDRTDEQAADRRGEKAEVWNLAAKYDANSLYASVMYGESRNMTPLEKTTFGSFANHTQNIEAVVQYQFDFGLRPSLGYVYAKGKDLGAKEDTNADIMNYVELGAWYYFNKNFNVYTAYKFNLIDDEDSAITGASTDDQFAVGITYQF